MINIFKSFAKGQSISFIMCLFFSVPHFLMAQTFPLNIGLGTSLGFEFANNTTNTVTANSGVTGHLYYYHNKNKYTDTPIDAYLTIDIKYLEASIGLWWGSRTIFSRREGTWTLGIPGNTSNSKNIGEMNGWTWNIFLKTPAFSKINWFPILGIESRIMTRLSPGNDADTDLFVDNQKTWNNFWYKFGIGLDRVILFDKVFARMEYLLGFRDKNQYEKNLQKIKINSVDGIPFSISAKITIYYKIQ